MAVVKVVLSVGWLVPWWGFLLCKRSDLQSAYEQLVEQLAEELAEWLAEELAEWLAEELAEQFESGATKAASKADSKDLTKVYLMVVLKVGSKAVLMEANCSEHSRMEYYSGYSMTEQS